MKIAELRAYPTSFPLPPDASVTLGIGRAVKRDAVVVKVTSRRSPPRGSSRSTPTRR